MAYMGRKRPVFIICAYGAFQLFNGNFNKRGQPRLRVRNSAFSAVTFEYRLRRACKRDNFKQSRSVSRNGFQQNKGRKARRYVVP